MAHENKVRSISESKSEQKRKANKKSKSQKASSEKEYNPKTRTNTSHRSLQSKVKDTSRLKKQQTKKSKKKSTKKKKVSTKESTTSPSQKETSSIKNQNEIKENNNHNNQNKVVSEPTIPNEGHDKLFSVFQKKYIRNQKTFNPTDLLFFNYDSIFSNTESIIFHAILHRSPLFLLDHIRKNKASIVFAHLNPSIIEEFNPKNQSITISNNIKQMILPLSSSREYIRNYLIKENDKKPITLERFLDSITKILVRSHKIIKQGGFFILILRDAVKFTQNNFIINRQSLRNKNQIQDENKSKYDKNNKLSRQNIIGVSKTYVPLIESVISRANELGFSLYAEIPFKCSDNKDPQSIEKAMLGENNKTSDSINSINRIEGYNTLPFGGHPNISSISSLERIIVFQKISLESKDSNNSSNSEMYSEKISINIDIDEKIPQHLLKTIQSPIWEAPPLPSNSLYNNLYNPFIIKILILLFSSRGDLIINLTEETGTITKLASKLYRNCISTESDNTFHQILSDLPKMTTLPISIDISSKKSESKKQKSLNLYKENEK